MEPVFHRSTILTIPDLLAHLRPVRFPESHQVKAKDLVKLKRTIRHNCEMLCDYAYVQLRESPLSDSMTIMLKQLLRDAHETRRECGKVSVNFLGPRHGRILTGVRAAYEDLRLTALLVCQQSEPTLMDSLTISL